MSSRVRKDTRPSLTSPYCKRQKAGQVLRTRRSLQSWNTFEWKAITFSRAHQDQEMLLLVPGSQSIVIGHTQYLWGLAMAAVLVMFQMYLPLRFGSHGGCWCDNPHGRWWYRCCKVCSKKCLGSWWRDWDPLQICTKKTLAKSVTLEDKLSKKHRRKAKVTVWLVHCVHILLTTLRNTCFIFLCKYLLIEQPLALLILNRTTDRYAPNPTVDSVVDLLLSLRQKLVWPDQNWPLLDRTDFRVTDPF